jgi:hypothetical protein
VRRREERRERRKREDWVILIFIWREGRASLSATV